MIRTMPFRERAHGSWVTPAIIDDGNAPTLAAAISSVLANDNIYGSSFERPPGNGTLLPLRARGRTNYSHDLTGRDTNALVLPGGIRNIPWRIT